MVSALALICVFATAAISAWSAKTATTYSGGWVDHYSAPVTPPSSGGAWVRVEAPAWPNGICGLGNFTRCAKARLASDHSDVQTKCCGGGSPAPACCKYVGWQATGGTAYEAYAWQEQAQNPNCGPVKAMIAQNTVATECPPDEGPEGE